jgi:hypothetical protein
VPRTLPDGSIELERVPLTLEDVLHPQEDDEIPVRRTHALDCTYLFNVFGTRPLGPPTVYVSFDHLVHWGVPDQRDTSPDVAIFVGMQRLPSPGSGTVDLPELGGRCILVVEVVSPERRENDVVHKFVEYHRAGVPLYVIIDQERVEGPRRILGYRWEPHGYEEIAQDERGLLIDPLGLYLSLSLGEPGDEERVVCRDVATRRELGNYSRLAQELEAKDQALATRTRELEAADRRNQEQNQALEESTLQTRAERLAREAAEQNAREQKQAREAAEQTREAAERLAREQTQAREAAERLAREQRQAREAAEQAQAAAERQRQADAKRIQELEAALARLQGTPPP